MARVGEDRCHGSPVGLASIAPLARQGLAVRLASLGFLRSPSIAPLARHGLPAFAVMCAFGASRARRSARVIGLTAFAVNCAFGASLGFLRSRSIAPSARQGFAVRLASLGFLRSRSRASCVRVKAFHPNTHTPRQSAVKGFLRSPSCAPSARHGLPAFAVNCAFGASRARRWARVIGLPAFAVKGFLRSCQSFSPKHPNTQTIRRQGFSAFAVNCAFGASRARRWARVIGLPAFAVMCAFGASWASCVRGHVRLWRVIGLPAFAVMCAFGASWASCVRRQLRLWRVIGLAVGLASLGSLRSRSRASCVRVKAFHPNTHTPRQSAGRGLALARRRETRAETQAVCTVTASGSSSTRLTDRPSDRVFSMALRMASSIEGALRCT